MGSLPLLSFRLVSWRRNSEIEWSGVREMAESLVWVGERREIERGVVI